MHLQSQIVVPQNSRQVWHLLQQPHFLAEWDRSVKEVVVTSALPVGTGFTFDTIAPSNGKHQGKRMNYRIISFEPGHKSTIALENSKMFKTAIWTMQVDGLEDGCRITCAVDIKLAPAYFYMAPLLWINKKALLRDLKYLQKAIELNIDQ